MNKLYEKSQLWFALVWIIVYVVGTSATDSFGKGLTLVFHLLLSLTALLWLRKKGLFTHYGLCRSRVSASKFLYYLPLIALSSCNLCVYEPG